MKFKIETREVLADAYLRPNPGTMLSHSAVVTDDGAIVEVLCDRVKIDSLADRFAGDPSAAPTCEHCQRWLKKRRELNAPSEVILGRREA